MVSPVSWRSAFLVFSFHSLNANEYQKQEKRFCKAAAVALGTSVNMILGHKLLLISEATEDIR